MKKKNEELGKARLPDDVATFIASGVITNMGQLEGCLLKAWVRADLDSVPLSIDLVEDALKDVIPKGSGEQDLEKNMGPKNP